MSRERYLAQRQLEGLSKEISQMRKSLCVKLDIALRNNNQDHVKKIEKALKAMHDDYILNSLMMSRLKTR